MPDSNSDIIILKNQSAIFIWIFTVIWLIISCVIVDLLVTQPENLEEWVLLTVYGIVGLGSAGLISYSLVTPVVYTMIDKKTSLISVSKKYLTKKHYIVIPFKDIESFEIERTSDGDGGDYYKLNLFSKNEDQITIEESSSEQKLISTRDRCIKLTT